jgi:hypothetical protein
MFVTNSKGGEQVSWSETTPWWTATCTISISWRFPKKNGAKLSDGHVRAASLCVCTNRKRTGTYGKQSCGSTSVMRGKRHSKISAEINAITIHHPCYAMGKHVYGPFWVQLNFSVRIRVHHILYVPATDFLHRHRYEEDEHAPPDMHFVSSQHEVACFSNRKPINGCMFSH